MGSKHIILASFVLAMAATGSTAHAFNSDLISENREQLRERFEEPWFDRRDVSHEERRACAHYKKYHHRHSHRYEHHEGHKHKRVHTKQTSEPQRIEHRKRVEKQHVPTPSSQSSQSNNKANR